MESNRSAQPFSSVLAPGLFTGVTIDWNRGVLNGPEVRESTKTLRDLACVFRDLASLEEMDGRRAVYRVHSWAPAPAGTEGGLFWGVTVLEPGKVGDEYFMTHGHFHLNPTRAEFYATVAGQGILLRMERDRRTWGEPMSAGSLHSIDGAHAHRVVNAGDEPLIFWACWPADAGYDYGSIAQDGFGARVLDRDGAAAIVHEEEVSAP